MIYIKRQHYGLNKQSDMDLSSDNYLPVLNSLPPSLLISLRYPFILIPHRTYLLLLLIIIPLFIPLVSLVSIGQCRKIFGIF